MEQSYNSFIESILNTRGRHGCGNEYFETHHVIPRCLGGSNDDDNLIDLYAREHFIAHKLLAHENFDNEKLVSAYALMAFMNTNDKRIIEISPEEYEDARIQFSNSMKNRWENDEYREMQTERLKRLWNDDEYRKIQSERRTRLNNEMWSNPEHRKRMSAKVKERWENASEEYIENAKNTMKNVSNKLWQDEKYREQHYAPVMCIETNEYFLMQQDAVQKYNVSFTGISNYLAGRQKSAGKHPITREPLHWKRVSVEECKSHISQSNNNEIDLLRSNAS